MSEANPGRLRALVITPWFPHADNPMQGVHVRDQIRAAVSGADVEVIYLPKEYPSKLAAGGVVEREPMSAEWTRGLPVVRVSTRRLPGPSTSRAVRGVAVARTARTLLAGRRFDVIHGETSLVAPEVLVTGRRLGAPTVITDHWGDLVTGRASRGQERLLRRVLPRIDRVVAATPAHAQALVDRGFVSSADVVPCVFDLESFAPAVRGVAERSRGQPMQLISVGSIAPTKGQRDLVRAIGMLRDDGVTVELDVVGDGTGRGDVEHDVAELGLEGSVRFSGQLPRPEIARRLAASDLYVLPSHSEMFSVATLEAAACGLPVVATRCGMFEYLSSDASITVEPADPRSMADGLRRAFQEIDPLGAAARRHAPELRRRYSEAAVGAQVVDLYRSVLA